MGNTCKPLAVSFQCMTKSTTNKKKKRKKKKIPLPKNVSKNQCNVLSELSEIPRFKAQYQHLTVWGTADNFLQIRFKFPQLQNMGNSGIYLTQLL